MPVSPPQTPSDLLGAVLASVARDTGAVSVLTPVWRALVGPTVAGATKPSRLVGRTLVVHCASPAWAEALRADPSLLTRLQARLGKKTVDALVFEP